MSTENIIDIVARIVLNEVLFVTDETNCDLFVIKSHFKVFLADLFEMIALVGGHLGRWNNKSENHRSRSQFHRFCTWNPHSLETLFSSAF